MPFVLCADFAVFPDDLQLGPAFTLSAMDFQDNPGGMVSFVNETAGTKGLQFPDSGIVVRLPTVVPWARLYVGQFNTPFTIDGLGPAGNVVSTTTVNNPNTYLYINIAVENLATIRLLGGGNEGVLVSLCLLIP